MPNAREGKWVIGPGKALFSQLNKELPDLRIIAEDLGCVNKRVRKLLAWCGYPGMKVLTFGFDSDESNPHFIGHYGRNTVAYTGTHDNDTTLGWAQKADPKVLKFAMDTLGFSTLEEAPDAFIRALFKTPCDTVVVPMQDVLGLDGSARMNLPGTIGCNWLWRMRPDALTSALSLKYYTLNKETNRR
jgi:4-alpha-glucanotransferase